MNNRIVAIRIRSLRTTEGEDRPSEVCFRNPDGATECFDLVDQQAEVDFIIGVTPVAWREVKAGETVEFSDFAEHHLKWTALKTEKLEAARSEGRIVREVPAIKKGGESTWLVLDEIPTQFIGIKPGDRVVTIFGGSGNLFIRDLVEHWAGQGVEVWRIPPYRLKDRREVENQDKNNDVELLITTYLEHPEYFHLMRPLDNAVASLSAVFCARQEAMRQRIRVGNRLIGRARQALLREKRAGHPVDTLEVAAEAAKSSDRLFQNLLAEEMRAERELAVLLEQIEIWGVLSQVTGVGVAIGSRIIAKTGDIRRFMFAVDSPELRRLRAERDELFRQAGYETFKGLMDSATLAATKNGFERIVAVRKFCLENDMTVEADLLQKTIELTKRIGKLQRRGAGESKFIAYCGLHVLPDGRFARQRGGEKANWSPILRQAFYLLTDQFNRRPASEWGKRLLANKAGLRERHPEIIVVDDKKRYTNGHILKMARWRTATQFARWFYNAWVKLERSTTG